MAEIAGNVSSYSIMSPRLNDALFNDLAKVFVMINYCYLSPMNVYSTFCGSVSMDDNNKPHRGLSLCYYLIDTQCTNSEVHTKINSICPQ